MRGFKFRLQRVHEVKQIILGIRQRELADAKGMFARELNLLNSTHDRACKARVAAKHQTRGNIIIDEMITHGQYLSYLDQQIRIQKTRVSNAESVVDSRRRLLLEARKDTKMLDRLRAKKASRHLKQVQYTEQLLLDELAADAFLRGVRERA